MLDIKKMFDLTGKVAIVTGATKGLGRGMAEALAQSGANIVVVSRTPKDCENVAKELAELGVQTLAQPCDVTKKESIEELVAKTVEKFGKIDILVNNAGTAVTKPALELTEDDWDWVVNTNMKSIFLLSQAVGKHMAEQKSGKVINIASMFGLVGDKNVLPYLASKGGVVQMTRGLALEWTKYNIQVNAVAPGYVITAINEKEFQEEKVYNYITGKTPMRRIGKVEEVAGIVVYLASEASNFTTGAVYTVDGGWTVQ
ncbi:MAG: glucose 1-dehydrogenase [Peptococcia bacterium]